ncbi:MAG: phosphoribosyltransferase [Actinomycetales bacterium]|nr:phosphoribosyltransferase [Actinomycetales bacterium]
MFRDRSDAGRQLAARLATYDLPNPLVLGLPRGGVPVAAHVADALGAELDVLVVRKLGAPGNPEYAIGAVGEDGALVVDHSATRALRVTRDQLDRIAEAERREIARRVEAYRDGVHQLSLAGRNLIIVDDGLATGSTAAAGVRVARHLGAAHITVAVPVGSVQAVDWLRGMADTVVCLDTPEPFYAVGQHYTDFAQVSDAEVVRILKLHPRHDDRRQVPARSTSEDVEITCEGLRLPGHLHIPARARGVVLFAHGSGSSRRSPRNVSVAKQLQSAGIGTLLFDLLAEDEADNRANVFDIELLAERLLQATTCVHDMAEAAGLPLGYFGASTGAAAALVAAAEAPDHIAAVVSRGGRPDLAGVWLEKVQAPTLLIVGGRDYPVIDLNRQAQAQLQCPNLLEIVPGATHLFEEPGTLAQAGRLAQSWFLRHFA